ncbi:unnamed protein product [Owenia fusiformis]|uniref:vitamin-K-epoxide reductase (warfarin-sensitive) n=1 Tax=Owenia fusiformis TaxID=6347 RepID=A0A8J1TMV2_OWEFU|nr:unnamed protein product [Owenia fusiformis]
MTNYFFIRFLNATLCILGIILSIYAYYVEFNKERDPMFRAMCDYNGYVSCSKVFTSRWGRGFGLLEYVVDKDHWLNQPNSIFGLTFYVFQIMLGENHTVSGSIVQLVFSCIANLGSIYLGCILYFILQDFCIICVSTYIVNATLLGVNILKYNHMQSRWKKKST